MSLKFECVETLCPSVTGNYDITGATPNNDMIGALFINGASTTHNNTATGRWSFGATDLVNNVGVSIAMQDGNANAGARGMMSASHCLFTANALGAQVAPIAAYSSTLSNGVRLNVTSVTANRLTETCLISGTGAAMKVGTQYIASGSTSAVVTHGLGGTPDVIILLTAQNIASNTDEVDCHGVSMGFWDRASGNQSCVILYMTDAAATTDIAGAAFNNSAGEIFAGTSGTSAAHVTLTSVGSTTFTISLSANPATNNMYGWIALRGTAAQLFTKNVLTTMPTGTGNNTPISGMSGRPQFLMTIPTRLTAANTVATDDSAGSEGVSIAASTTSTYGNQACTFKDGVATSVSKTDLNNQYAVMKCDNTGNLDVTATVNSWDTGGVTLNYSAVGASAFEVAMLAIGGPTGNLPGSLATLGVGF